MEILLARILAYSNAKLWNWTVLYCLYSIFILFYLATSERPFSFFSILISLSTSEKDRTIDRPESKKEKCQRKPTFYYMSFFVKAELLTNIWEYSFRCINFPDNFEFDLTFPCGTMGNKDFENCIFLKYYCQNTILLYFKNM